jgi:uncharacterized YigZ family protein
MSKHGALLLSAAVDSTCGHAQSVQSVSYTVPAARHVVELVIERSRFIATVDRAADAAAARAFIDSVRADHPAATHNCWAYVAGPPGSTAHVGLSDAGEPHGTAGRPMFDVLLHSGVGEIAAVVTRYYGGVKLGKGGLVRAYVGSVQRALESLPSLVQVDRLDLRIEVGYSELEPVRRLLDSIDARIVAEEFGAAVVLIAAVPSAAADALRRGVADRTAGRARVSEAEDESGNAGEA